jgi:hypothetical protein
METKSFHIVEKIEVGIFNHPYASKINFIIENEIRKVGFSKQTNNNNLNAFSTVDIKSLAFIQDFKTYVLECVEVYNKKITGGCIKNPSITSMWAALYQKNDSTRSHKHIPNTYSFVYFVRSEKNHSPLKFDNSLFSFNGNPGNLIIFPSYLWHSVSKQKLQSPRITLIGNIIYDHFIHS